MTSLPRVAVSRWENVAGEQIEAYWRRLREAGLDPIDIHEPGQTLGGGAGLVLTGGVDIDPRRYGEAPHATVKRTEPGRDDLEASLLQEALDADLPVLAICRGHQLLNVVLGGSLLQHIESGEHVAQRDEARSSRWHEVTLTPSTRLADALGRERMQVNSRHHQAVTPARLAPGLTVAAMTEDGLVEAMESTAHRWVVGVQWHPEREESSEFSTLSTALFRAFSTAILQDSSRR